MRGNTLSDAGTWCKGKIKGAIKGAKGTIRCKRYRRNKKNGRFFTQERRGQCVDSNKASCIRIDNWILLPDTDALFVKLKQIIYKLRDDNLTLSLTPRTMPSSQGP